MDPDYESTEDTEDMDGDDKEDDQMDEEQNDVDWSETFGRRTQRHVSRKYSPRRGIKLELRPRPRRKEED